MRNEKFRIMIITSLHSNKSEETIQTTEVNINSEIRGKIARNFTKMKASENVRSKIPYTKWTERIHFASNAGASVYGGNFQTK